MEQSVPPLVPNLLHHHKNHRTVIPATATTPPSTKYTEEQLTTGSNSQVKISQGFANPKPPNISNHVLLLLGRSCNGGALAIPNASCATHSAPPVDCLVPTAHSAPLARLHAHGTPRQVCVARCDCLIEMLACFHNYQLVLEFIFCIYYLSHSKLLYQNIILWLGENFRDRFGWISYVITRGIFWSLSRA